MFYPSDKFRPPRLKGWLWHLITIRSLDTPPYSKEPCIPFPIGKAKSIPSVFADINAADDRYHKVRSAANTGVPD